MSKAHFVIKPMPGSILKYKRRRRRYFSRRNERHAVLERIFTQRRCHFSPQSRNSSSNDVETTSIVRYRLCVLKCLSPPCCPQEYHGDSRGTAGVNDAPLVRRGSRRLPEVPVNMGSSGRVRVLPRGLRIGGSHGQAAEESEEEGHQLNYYRRTVH